MSDLMIIGNGESGRLWSNAARANGANFLVADGTTEFCLQQVEWNGPSFVVVASPNSTHVDYLQHLPDGIRVLCEKPFVLNREELASVKEKWARFKLVTCAMVNRYRPEFAHRPQQEVIYRRRKATMRATATALYDIGPHVLDRVWDGRLIAVENISCTRFRVIVSGYDKAEVDVAVDLDAQTDEWIEDGERYPVLCPQVCFDEALGSFLGSGTMNKLPGTLAIESVVNKIDDIHGHENLSK